MDIKNQRKLKKEVKKISLIFASSIFLIVLILEIFLLGFQYFDYNNQEMQRLTFQAENFSRVINLNPNFEELINTGNFGFSGFGRPNGLQLKLEQKEGQGQRRIKLENFFIYDYRGNIVFSPFQDDNFYLEILTNIRENNGKKFSHNGIEYFFINKQINNNLSAVFFVESRFTIGDSLKEFLEYFIFALLLALLIYYISYKFVSRSLKPVEENIADMEQFIHNAGHELKTPISVIKSTLELAQLKKEYKESIKDSITELDKMNDLIQVLISLSTINPKTDVSVFNVNDIIKESIKIFGTKISEKNLSINIEELALLGLECNRDYFKILFNNIFNNAIKYNKKSGKIDIIIDKKRLEITDTGIGISEDNIGKIFDRFYQESESREINSFGIGLSLVKKIADIYGWEIQVTSNKGVGTTFIIKF